MSSFRALLVSSLAILAVSASLATSAALADGDGGKKLYVSQCQLCHGRNGDGKGPAGVALNPAPTDFTSAPFWKSHTDAQVDTSIQTGVPGTSMSGYASISEEQLADLLQYLQSFKAGPSK